MNSSTDTATLRAEIVKQVTRRAEKNPLNPLSTICPSEVARALWPEDWRQHMPSVRDIAYQLCDEGVIEITQGGVVQADPRASKGAIRLRAPIGI